MRVEDLFRAEPSNLAFVPIHPIPTIVLCTRMLLLFSFVFSGSYTRIEMISPWDNSWSTDISSNGGQLFRYLTQPTPRPIYIHLSDFCQIASNSAMSRKRKHTCINPLNKHFLCYIEY